MLSGVASKTFANEHTKTKKSLILTKGNVNEMKTYAQNKSFMQNKNRIKLIDKVRI
jgi:hypothetical protein